MPKTITTLSDAHAIANDTEHPLFLQAIQVLVDHGFDSVESSDEDLS